MLGPAASSGCALPPSAASPDSGPEPHWTGEASGRSVPTSPPAQSALEVPVACPSLSEAPAPCPPPSDPLEASLGYTGQARGAEGQAGSFLPWGSASVPGPRRSSRAQRSSPLPLGLGAGRVLMLWPSCLQAGPALCGEAGLRAAPGLGWDSRSWPWCHLSDPGQVRTWRPGQPSLRSGVSQASQP